MNIQINKQAFPADNFANKASTFQKNILNRYRRLSIPFSERKTLLLLGDAFLVGLAVFSALLLWQQTAIAGLDVATHIKNHWYWYAILLSGWLVLAWLVDLYHIPSSFDKMTSAGRVLVVGIINLVVYVAVFFLAPSQLPRLFFLYFLVIVWAAITLWRWTYAIVFSHLLPHRVLIVGQGERANRVSEAVKEASNLNFKVLGYVDEGKPNLQSASDGLPVFGRAVNLSELAQQLQVHEVVLAVERSLKTKLFELLVECQANGVRVTLMSDFYEKLCRKIPVEHIDRSWVMYAMQDRAIFNPFSLGAKRLLDMVLGIVGLLILIPILPIVALAIRLDSAGPIFYSQVRSGRAGKPFRIVKFRTMTNDAEKDGKARWATNNDARITRVGRYLRKTRLDEAPQVLNVLRGEMSIIGPRPERPEFIEELQRDIPFYSTRLMVKPGLTGWAQVQYRYGNSTEDALVKLEYDFYYLRYWSLWLDLSILFRTFAVVFTLNGT